MRVYNSLAWKKCNPVTSNSSITIPTGAKELIVNVEDTNNNMWNIPIILEQIPTSGTRFFSVGDYYNASTYTKIIVSASKTNVCLNMLAQNGKNNLSTSTTTLWYR